MQSAHSLLLAFVLLAALPAQHPPDQAPAAAMPPKMGREARNASRRASGRPPRRRNSSTGSAAATTAGPTRRSRPASCFAPRRRASDVKLQALSRRHDTTVNELDELKGAVRVLCRLRPGGSCLRMAGVETLRQAIYRLISKHTFNIKPSYNALLSTNMHF